ncbi:hypothetical protein SMMN14_09285 [Sphaerulina musiva]
MATSSNPARSTTAGHHQLASDKDETTGPAVPAASDGQLDDFFSHANYSPAQRQPGNGPRLESKGEALRCLQAPQSLLYS